MWALQCFVAFYLVSSRLFCLFLPCSERMSSHPGESLLSYAHWLGRVPHSVCECSVNIQMESTLHLLLRLRGGMQIFVMRPDPSLCCLVLHWIQEGHSPARVSSVSCLFLSLGCGCVCSLFSCCLRASRASSTVSVLFLHGIHIAQLSHS